MFLSDYRRLGWHLHIIKWVLVERTEDSLSLSLPPSPPLIRSDPTTQKQAISGFATQPFPAFRAAPVSLGEQEKSSWRLRKRERERMMPISIIYCLPIFAMFAAPDSPWQLTTLCWSLCWDSPQSAQPSLAQPSPICKYNQSKPSDVMLVWWWWRWWALKYSPLPAGY